MEDSEKNEVLSGKSPEAKTPSTMEIILSDKTFSIVIIAAIALIAALAAGALIGLITFKKAGKEIAPVQPATTVTAPVPVFKRVSTAIQQEPAPVQAEKRQTPVVKKQKKKPVKARKAAVAHRGTSVSPENIEKVIQEAKAGDADAQYRLGVMYAKGIGVSKDRQESLRWYRRAAGQGHAKAREALEFIYE